MTKQQAKEQAGRLYDEGKWVQLALLIARFGIELIQYLRERLKKKRHDDSQNHPEDEPPGADGPSGQQAP